MATYTLSHTGAEVDAAVNNATNLFSTPHTWTADQTFGNLTIQTGGLYVAEITTNEATIKSLRVEGAGAFASFGGGVVFNDYVTIESTGSLQVNGVANFAQNVIVTGEVVAGAAQFNGETDITGDLIVNNGVIYGNLSATDDLDMNGNDITNAGMVSANKIRLNSKIEMFVTATGISSALHSGVYISMANGSVSAFSQGASIPIGALVIYNI